MRLTLPPACAFWKNFFAEKSKFFEKSLYNRAKKWYYIRWNYKWVYYAHI